MTIKTFEFVLLGFACLFGDDTIASYICLQEISRRRRERGGLAA